MYSLAGREARYGKGLFLNSNGSWHPGCPFCVHRVQQIFEAKGEQFLKEVFIRNAKDHKRWAPKIRPEFEYEDEVCYEASINEVLEVVNSIKADWVAGVDKVLSTMLKSANHGFLMMLTLMINECLA